MDEKTRKAYRIDLTQLFKELGPILYPITENNIYPIDVEQIHAVDLEAVFKIWHETYKPKTVKRKIASVKAFFHWLEERDYIVDNPFRKIHTRFREPKTLPKTIPEHTLELFLQTLYAEYANAKTEFSKQQALKQVAVIELLFSTGMRISELCGLKEEDVNRIEGEILIHGKGRKERIIQIPDDHLLNLLNTYYNVYESRIKQSGYFFVGRNGYSLSDQSVRGMIESCCKKAGIEQHITPHMFRHTFATSLLESDVNLRCIQEILGHSSIQTTEIYTHVSAAKQRQILADKSPRKRLKIDTF